MKTILVTGGTGYIGSAIVKKLCEKKCNVIVLDNLSTTQKKYINKLSKFYKCDLNDKKKLESIFKENKINCVIHCAGKKAVGESEEKPIKYFQNNVCGLVNLLEVVDKYKIEKIIFSSSACVYKENKGGIFKEDDKLNSPNIYGFTKLQNENMIQEISRTKKINYVIFRYFNVSGDFGLNYNEKNALNIFPSLGRAIKEDKSFLIFGDKYKTIDGTGVRDYIHISDLVEAHIKAINYDKNEIFNLGTQKGVSVKQIICEVEKQLKRKIKKKIVENRSGDVGRCLANSKKAEKLLKWKAKKNICDIVYDFLRVYELK